MIKYLMIVIAALPVSLDAMLTGFTLSLQKQKNPFFPFHIAFINLLICLLFTFLSEYIRFEFAVIFGGIILIIIGIKNSISLKRGDVDIGKIEDNATSIKGMNFFQTSLLALGLSIDNAAAALSLSFSLKINIFIIPIIFSLTSLLLLLLGIMLFRFPLQKITKKLFLLPALTLSVLGIYKIITALIYIL